MATIQKQIADKFLAKLSESSDFTPEMVAELLALLDDGKKLKGEDLVKVFATASAGDLK